MCGIAGIIAADTSLVTKHKLRIMTDAISHRGPDGEQQWINEKGNAGFGHRRLAILDLSSAAVQPMHYLGRYTIVYNGEIYNYIELRDILKQKGYKFQSSSDTEVILAAYDRYGRECCRHFEGMFAFAIWDELNQELFAARDRFGEKPFYYTSAGSQFIFASEIKSIRKINPAHRVDPAQIINFLAIGHTRNGSKPDQSIYKDIFEIPPASYLYYQPVKDAVAVSQYWQLNKNADLNITEEVALEKFNELWTQSVKRSLRSDVSVGCSLSGGLDSSSIVAGIYESDPDIKLKTYSAVFPGFARDESAFVGLITERFQCENAEVIPQATDLSDDLEKLIWHHESFISSASVYAQYCVCRRAKEGGTVVLLDGQGADEILGGYTKYIHWALQEMYRQPGESFKKSFNDLRQNGIPFEWNWRNKIASWMPSLAANTLKQREYRKIRDSGFLQQDFLSSYSSLTHLADKPVVRNLNDILFYNTSGYGLNELLQYADRNCMAHGREIRLPFLNHELVSFLFSLPVQFKINQGFTKWILRKAMENRLPGAIVWRKDKVGYEPPQKSWMESAALQDKIHESKRSLVKAGIITAEALHKKIQPQDSHAADNYDWRFLVTDLLLHQ